MNLPVSVVFLVWCPSLFMGLLEEEKGGVEYGRKG